MRWLKQILCLTALLSLSACTSIPQGPGTPDLPPQSLGEIQKLLRQADALSSPEKEQLQLRAGAALMRQQQQEEAVRALLASMHPERLPGVLQAHYALLQAELALREGNTPSAFAWLDRPEVLRQTDPAIEAQSSLLKTEGYYRNGEFRAAIDEVELSESKFDASQKPLAYELLWRSLLQIDTGNFAAVSRQASGMQAGWLELASIFRSTEGLDSQRSRYAEWQQRWPTHPAANQPPSTVRSLLEGFNNRPQQIALLLPLSGRLQQAGQAIQDGFMAAYFQARQEGADVPRVRVYDSADKDIYALLQQTQNEGAELIIGPLQKPQVELLQQLPELPIPLLALNYGDDTQPPRGPLFQFGLASEDEARQAAQRAWQDGHRRAGILIPADEKGQRVAESFSRAWEELGGRVVARQSYADRTGFRQAVGHLLQIDQSEARAQRMRQLIGAVEFEPRRRQDLDLLFLHATPTDGRLIKPLLAFHFAADLPVYATSAIYTGEANATLDQDLNGIRFTLMPWLSSEDSLRQAVSSSFPESRKGSYGRLYALGADAWRLHPYLQQLHEHQGTQMSGYTGLLHLDNQQRVHRQLNWYQFDAGLPVPLGDVQSRASDHAVLDAQPTP